MNDFQYSKIRERLKRFDAILNGKAQFTAREGSFVSFTSNEEPTFSVNDIKEEIAWTDETAKSLETDLEQKRELYFNMDKSLRESNPDFLRLPETLRKSVIEYKNTLQIQLRQMVEPVNHQMKTGRVGNNQLVDFFGLQYIEAEIVRVRSDLEKAKTQKETELDLFHVKVRRELRLEEFDPYGLPRAYKEECNRILERDRQRTDPMVMEAWEWETKRMAIRARIEEQIAENERLTILLTKKRETLGGKTADEWRVAVETQSKLHERLIEVENSQRKISVIELLRESPQHIAAADEIKGALNVLRIKGEMWTLRFGGGTEFQLRNSKGLRYLYVLLRNPKKDFSSLNLYHEIGESNIPPNTYSSYQEMGEAELNEEGLTAKERTLRYLPDSKAFREYKRRIDDLKEEIEEAERNNDKASEERAKKDREQVLNELVSATKMRGKSHSEQSEKCRKAVYGAIYNALEKIDRHDEALYRHLKNAIKTGNMLSYVPEEELLWEF